MPKKRIASPSPVSQRKSPRAATQAAGTPPPPLTRAIRSRSSKNPDTERNASPSPSSLSRSSRDSSRSRSQRGAGDDAVEAEPVAAKPAKGRRSRSTQGDSEVVATEEEEPVKEKPSSRRSRRDQLKDEPVASSSRGRVTRAVVQEVKDNIDDEEPAPPEPIGRGRSAKRSPAPTRGRGRSAKGLATEEDQNDDEIVPIVEEKPLARGRGRSAGRAKKEPEVEEAEVVEEAVPEPSKKGRQRGRKSAAREEVAADPVETETVEAKEVPSQPVTKRGRRSASKAEEIAVEEPEAQADTEEVLSPRRGRRPTKTPPKPSPRGRRGKSASKSEEVVDASAEAEATPEADAAMETEKIAEVETAPEVEATPDAEATPAAEPSPRGRRGRPKAAVKEADTPETKRPSRTRAPKAEPKPRTTSRGRRGKTEPEVMETAEEEMVADENAISKDEEVSDTDAKAVETETTPVQEVKADILVDAHMAEASAQDSKPEKEQLDAAVQEPEPVVPDEAMPALEKVVDAVEEEVEKAAEITQDALVEDISDDPQEEDEAMETEASEPPAVDVVSDVTEKQTVAVVDEDSVELASDDAPVEAPATIEAEATEPADGLEGDKEAVEQEPADKGQTLGTESEKPTIVVESAKGVPVYIATEESSIQRSLGVVAPEPPFPSVQAIDLVPLDNDELDDVQNLDGMIGQEANALMPDIIPISPDEEPVQDIMEDEAPTTDVVSTNELLSAPVDEVPTELEVIPISPEDESIQEVSSSPEVSEIMAPISEYENLQEPEDQSVQEVSSSPEVTEIMAPVSAYDKLQEPEVVQQPETNVEAVDQETAKPVVDVSDAVLQAEETGQFAINDQQADKIVDEDSVNNGAYEEDPSRMSKRKRDDVEEDQQLYDDEDILAKKARIVEAFAEEENLINGGTSHVDPVIPVEVAMETEVEPVASTAAEVDVTEGYVVIDMNEVPPVNSQDITESLPKMTAEASDSFTEIIPEEIPPVSDPVQEAHAVQPPIQTTDFAGGVPPDLLLNRNYISNPSIDHNAIESAKKFNIASYNILAECHLNSHKESYFPDSPQSLDPAFRIERLLEEMRYLDADVICLQEVSPDYFTRIIEPTLQILGYAGTFMKRTFDHFDEGEATFHKVARFTLEDVSRHSLSQLAQKEIQECGLSEEISHAVLKNVDAPEVVLVTRLRCNYTNNVITVGNVHISWVGHTSHGVQCIQIASAIKEIVRQAGSDTNPHFICGDFNNKPSQAGYQLAKDGYLSDDMILSLQADESVEMPDGPKASLVNLVWQAFQHTSSNLKSAYSTVLGREPEVTMKLHNNPCVDYLFYSSGSVDALGVLETASAESLEAYKTLPSLIYPSDHISIKADFAFK